jgi:sugar phosphate isomerase/epimerase
MARNKSTAKRTPKAAPPPAHPCRIRIGTMVNDGRPEYLRAILPHGFESFQVNFWQAVTVDLKTRAAEVAEVLDGTDTVVSSLGIFGNPLDPAHPKHAETVAGWKACIDHAHLFGCDLVCGFTGRVIGQPIDASMKTFKKVFGDLARRAADRGVRLAFENCDMGGNWRSGDWNIAHNPTAWEMMFDAVPADNLGLEWEPCHQMVNLIDPLPQLRTWAPKVFHVHGKDATVAWDVVREHGIGGPRPFAWHRTPGFGDTDWTDVITILRLHGYVGSIDIEGWHDPVYRDDLEMVGQVRGLNYLKDCRGGDFVANPA